MRIHSGYPWVHSPGLRLKQLVGVAEATLPEAYEGADSAPSDNYW